MSDVVDRINRWIENEGADDADQTLRDARDEIVALRAMLKRQSEAALQSVSLLSQYAQRSGWFLGGLEMVAAGETTADAVLSLFKEKFPNGPA